MNSRHPDPRPCFPTLPPCFPTLDGNGLRAATVTNCTSGSLVKQHAGSELPLQRGRGTPSRPYTSQRSTPPAAYLSSFSCFVPASVWIVIEVAEWTVTLTSSDWSCSCCGCGCGSSSSLRLGLRVLQESPHWGDVLLNVTHGDGPSERVPCKRIRRLRNHCQHQEREEENQNQESLEGRPLRIPQWPTP